MNKGACEFQMKIESIMDKIPSRCLKKEMKVANQLHKARLDFE